ncbi:MAG: DUF2341 domain-containing protein [Candidatus Hodarchaeota archaeon]
MGSRRRVIVLTLFTLFFFSLLPTVVSASPDGESWLPGWTYRKSHLIYSAPDAGTNYQVKIIVHYGSGTDVSQNVYCNGLCKTDFGDIRFTDNDGITALDYWMEEKTDSVSATFWVKIADDLSLISVNIYIYYGNSGSTSTSNGDATFLEFTHFAGTSLPADWTVRDSDMGTHSVSDSKLTVTSDTVSHSTWYHRIVGPTSSFTMPIRVRALVTSYAYHTSRKGPTFEIGNLADMDLCYFHYGGGHSVHTHYDGSTLRHNVIDEALSQQWAYIDNPIQPGTWELVSDAACNRFYSNDVFLDSLDTYSIDGSVYVSVGVCSGGSSGSAGSIVMDWLFVSKFINPEPAHGSWGSEESNWLPGWSHRKSHVINPGSGAGTGYQVKIVVHYGTGTDSGENAYCDSQCRTDFGDIRFTDDGGLTELDYWIEEKVDFNYGVFWVEVRDDLSTTGATIFMYYGNSTAATTSNGPNTFLVFDDFEDGDTAGWTVVDGSFTGSTDYSYDSSYSAKLDPTVLDTIAFAYQTLTPDDYCIVAWIYCHERGDQWDSYALQGRMTDVNNRYEAALTNQRIKIREVTGGIGSDLADAAFPDSDKYGKWNKHEFRLSGTQFRYWINGTEYLTGTDDTHTSGYIALRNYKNEAEDIAYFDCVHVRKYTEPEPQHGIWGSQLPQNGQQDPTIIIIAAAIGIVAAIGIAAILKTRSPRPEVAVPEPRRPVPEPSYEEEPVPEEITPEREEVEAPEPVLPSDVLCSYCGYANPAGAKFCIRCGRHLE